jgi:hypothetical protein
MFRTHIITAIGIIALAMKLKAQTAGLGDPSNWALFLHGNNLQIGYYCLNAGINGCFTLLLGARRLPAYFKYLDLIQCIQPGESGGWVDKSARPLDRLQTDVTSLWLQSCTSYSIHF